MKGYIACPGHSLKLQEVLGTKHREGVSREGFCMEFLVELLRTTRYLRVARGVCPPFQR